MNNLVAGIAGGVAVALVATSALVFATRGDDKTEVAATKTECTTERVVTNKEWGANSVAGTILGGAAGAAIGHQIGGGSGKDAATAVGAVGGAYAGNKVAKKHYPDQEVSYRERCREVPAG
ncbi:MAG TPA: glycine zipper 2TM domain-containing protein [Solimonas sp.]